MTPETLAKLTEMKAVASTLKESELRVERARTELSRAEQQLSIVAGNKRALQEALQGAVECVIRDISLRNPAGEMAEIVAWFVDE